MHAKKLDKLAIGVLYTIEAGIIVAILASL